MYDNLSIDQVVDVWVIYSLWLCIAKSKKQCECILKGE